MRRTLATVLLGLTIPVSAVVQPELADLIITNARVITGTGAVLDDASVVVTDGRIVSVTSDLTDVQAAREIDATGMTVMPGLIDTHSHLFPFEAIGSDEEFARWMETELAPLLQAYLESGVTTVMSAGDYFPTIVDVRKRLEDGELIGPRLLVSGPLITAPEGHPAVTVCRDNPWCRRQTVIEVDSREAAREHVRILAEAGVDAIKVVYDGMLGAQIADDVVAAIGEEGDRQGLPLTVHVLNVVDTMTVLDLGVDRFVHPPFNGTAAGSGVGEALREQSVPVSTTVGTVAPLGL